ncbi:SDR family oxidoreductase, partial [Candidatus Pelagibacter bacterium]
MKNKILITGGCGYIGTKLVNLLLKQNKSVIAVDTQWFGNYLKNHKNLKVIKSNIRDLNSKIFKNVETVIHLASVSNDPSSDLSPKLSWEAGPLATLELLENCKKNNVKNFFYASSGSVYGVSKKNKVDEDHPLLPISDYNKQKMVTEKVVETFAKKIRVVIIRPATVCGYSKRLRLDTTVNILSYQAYKNNLITVFGGSQIRPNIHIDDMVNVYNFFLKNKKSGIYNVGFENLSVLNIAKMIQKKTNCKIKILKSTDPRSYRLSSKKILKNGFKPKKKVLDAIDELLYFFNNSKYQSSSKNVN